MLSDATRGHNEQMLAAKHMVFLHKTLDITILILCGAAYLRAGWTVVRCVCAADIVIPVVFHAINHTYTGPQPLRKLVRPAAT